MIQQGVLPNGIRVVSDFDANAKSVSLYISFAVGSRFETEAEGGLSHVLEHMAFKGTKTRTASQIETEAENVGAQLNAHTSWEETAYEMRVLQKDVPLAVDILSDILQNSVFPKEEWEKERGTILQEIAMGKDRPTHDMSRNFFETLFPGQALGRPIIGTEEKVKSFSREQILAYMQKHYHAGNMIISASGAVNHADFMALCVRAFSKIAPAHEVVSQPAVYGHGDIRVQKPHNQINLMMGFPTGSYRDEHFYTSNVLAQILGGGMSSRLFQEIREKRGLVYTVYASTYEFMDAGTLLVYAGTGEKEVKELMPVLCDELVKMADHLSDEEIERAKTQIKAAQLMQREDIGARSGMNADSLQQYGRLISDEELIQKIDSVSRSDLLTYAKKTFTARPVFSVSGPIKNVMPYHQILDRLGITR